MRKIDRCNLNKGNQTFGLMEMTLIRKKETGDDSLILEDKYENQTRQK